jgi:hypothetical protein
MDLRVSSGFQTIKTAGNVHSVAMQIVDGLDGGVTGASAILAQAVLRAGLQECEMAFNDVLNPKKDVFLGEAAQDTGKMGRRFLTIWNVRAARDLTWDFCDHLRDLRGLIRKVAVAAQDKLTGVIGRTILLPT